MRDTSRPQKERVNLVPWLLCVRSGERGFSVLSFPYALDAFLFGHFASLHCLGTRWIELVTVTYVYVGILVTYFKLNA